MSFKKPGTYAKGNRNQIIFLKDLMKECKEWINWREDGRDSLLDVGTGPGHTTLEVIYPLLPPNFSRLVCSDISPAMVESEKNIFQNVSKVSCELLDIASEPRVDLDKFGTFDHITSFFVLMWVPNQKNTFRNIFDLMKPGGDCFHQLVAESAVFDAVFTVARDPRWSDLFEGWEVFDAFPYRNLDEAINKAKNYMIEAGFVDIRVEFREQELKFQSAEEVENFIRSLPNPPCVEEGSADEEAIIQERLLLFNKFNLGNFRDNTDKIRKPHTHLILYGKKPRE